jgi:hypothetical protein
LHSPNNISYKHLAACPCPACPLHSPNNISQAAACKTRSSWPACCSRRHVLHWRVIRLSGVL